MVFNKLSSLKISTFAACFVCVVATFADGQANDLSPIEKAKMYPPSVLGNNDNRVNLLSIKWQAEQNEILIKEYQVGRAKVDDQIDALNDQIDALNQELSSEIRMLDSKVRSQLIGKVMEQYLMAKLDLATQSAEIGTLEGKLKLDAELRSKLDQSKIAEQELALVAASKKAELATVEYEKAKKLAAKGYQSDSQLQIAKYTVDVATLEVEAAKNELEVAMVEGKVKQAQQLSSSRVEVGPLKARVAAAEEFLDRFSAGGKVTAKIEKLKRAVELLEKDRQIYATELSRVGRESHELDLLLRRINKAMSKKEAAEKEEE